MLSHLYTSTYFNFFFINLNLYIYLNLDIDKSTVLKINKKKN